MSNSIAETIMKVQAEVSTKYNEAIPEFTLDTKINRFPKMNTWVSGITWTDDRGEEQCSITFGNWKASDGNHRINSFDNKNLKRKKFRENFELKVKSVNEKIANETKDKNEKCRVTWLAKWKKMESGEIHDYLIDKGIETPFNSRVDSNGVMIVPIYDTKRFVGVQRIYLNPESEQYEKRFASGIKIKGSFSPLLPFKDAELIYVTEGYSTACTIQTAFPLVPVVCVFNAGNIVRGIESIKRINPSAKIIICADRDKESGTGEKFARKACKLFNPCIYKIPYFENDNGKWSDYNDLHQFNSLKKVQDQLVYRPSDFVIIEAIGYKDEFYYYISSENTQINCISAGNHTERHLYRLVPDRSWWMKNYPAFDPDDEEQETPIKVNWTQASNSLMKKCHDVGLVDTSNVRSSGCWEDNGKFFFHNGRELYNGHKKIDIFSSNLICNYVSGKACHSLSRSKMLSEEERSGLYNIFMALNTRTEQQALLMLGWLVVAPVAGALSWRPHIFLTGESSQGKSWVMENIIGNLLRGFCIRPQGASTEAGIRQTAGHMSLPIVYDEFETDDQHGKERNAKILELARQSSTPTEADLMKGTVSGKAISFSPNFAMCVSAINLPIEHKQDKNRWTVIEFSKERSNDEQFEYVKKNVRAKLGFDFGEKLVSYSFHHLDLLVKNFNSISDYLLSKGHKGHFQRQYGMLLAGLLIIIHNEELDQDSLYSWLDTFDFGYFKEQSGEDDPKQLLEELLSSFIVVDREKIQLKEAINLSNLTDGKCVYRDALQRYGIKAGTNYFLLKKGNNKSVNHLLSKTKWQHNWAITLLRLDRIKKHEKVVKIAGVSCRTIKIPFTRWSNNEGE